MKVEKIKKSNDIFQRYEKKYILTVAQQRMFLERVKEYLVVDQYGESTICNLYYDTPSYELIRSSIDKPAYKEKLRLRSYCVPGKKGKTFVEIKKKYDGIVYKRRIELPLEQAEHYLDHGISPEMDTQIKREIDYFLQHYQPSVTLYACSVMLRRNHGSCLYASRKIYEAICNYDYYLTSVGTIRNYVSQWKLRNECCCYGCV